MKIPFFDPTRIEPELAAAISSAVCRVLASGEYILGPEVIAFEREVAEWIGVPHAVGVGNGTDAMTIALRAIGIRPGDAVLTSPLTFFATVSAILSVGAIPVFADVNPDTFNIDPALASDVLEGRCNVLRRIGVRPERIRAIVPVHLYGQAADMESLCDVARSFGVTVIEDAAQSFGATWAGRQVGTFGAAGCFSFFPTKNLGTAGDGGLVTTDDDHLAGRLRALRAHGSHTRYRHDLVGTNTRLDALHAAILRCKLPYVHRWITARREHARGYDDALGMVAGVVAPTEAKGASHTYNQYTVRIGNHARDAWRNRLTDAGVGSSVYYPLPAHLQPALGALRYRTDDYPIAEAACAEVLSLPIHPGLTGEERGAVVDALRGDQR